jgi:hypothetical protein
MESGLLRPGVSCHRCARAVRLKGQSQRNEAETFRQPTRTAAIAPMAARPKTSEIAD